MDNAPESPCTEQGSPTHTCPLCGARFRHSGRLCEGCRIAGKPSGMVCCPNCGHIFPERSLLVDRLSNWWRSRVKG
jgi:predicted amidophosphoribosyltransferase